MYKFPYLLLKQQLASKVEVLKEVAFYRGQDKKKKGTLKTLPGAYIKFLPTELKSLGGTGIQQGDLEFEVMLITDCMYDDDKRYSDESDLNHLDIVNKIHLALNGHSSLLSMLTGLEDLEDTDADYKVYNSIKRTDIATDDEGIDYMITVQTFKTFCFDASGSHEWIAAVNDIGLIIEDLSFDI